MTTRAPHELIGTTLEDEVTSRWGAAVRVMSASKEVRLVVDDPSVLPGLCRWLSNEVGYQLATLVTEETQESWLLHYLFWGDAPTWVHVLLEVPLNVTEVPSISDAVHAADWHERETEDLFGLSFKGHPRLGEFILHDEWPEGTNPMRRSFDWRGEPIEDESGPQWRPERVLHAPGAFSMPVGPVFSGVGQAAHFLLETVGEDVLRTVPRLFYKYRGVEKLAEGRTPDQVVLLAERFAGTSAVAHAWAFCRAVERIAGVSIPLRAQLLRVVFAELERFRHHLTTSAGIVHSTGMTVASSQADLLVEEALRSAGAVVGHRYLFGQIVPGGMYRDWRDEQLTELSHAVASLAKRFSSLVRMLRYSSSFLDRLEEVGIVTGEKARDYGLVGPVARACGINNDLRAKLPYGAYSRLFRSKVPTEQEGDGYARLRVLVAEAHESVRLIQEAIARLAPGPVRVDVPTSSGQAVGWSEAPRGAAFHWVRLTEEGRVARYRLTTPSFINWHGFHLAAERFAFQDFPIIMATFGVSTAEGDR